MVTQTWTLLVVAAVSHSSAHTGPTQTNRMASPCWADLSPTAQEERRSRFHPALLPPQPPPAPRLGPVPEPPSPVGLDDLPPPGPSDANDDATAPATETMAAGLSPWLLWGLFVTWRARWGHLVGISPPAMLVLAAYVRSYLFHEEPVRVLVALRQLLVMLLPERALGPRWLWRLLWW